jgi:hypothetical protein
MRAPGFWRCGSRIQPARLRRLFGWMIIDAIAIAPMIASTRGAGVGSPVAPQRQQTDYGAASTGTNARRVTAPGRST